MKLQTNCSEPSCLQYVVVAIFVAAFTVHAGGQAPSEAQRVDKDRIVAAMRLQRGYDVTATTNAARFKASTILQLVRWAREREPNGSLLFIDHEDMYRAYLETTGIAADRAPVFIRLPHDNRQDFLIENRNNRVVKKVVKGPAPDLALSIKEWWPKASDLPSKYSYVDTTSNPNLTMTTQRVVTYRLLQIGDMVVYDEIRGLSGRPTSGALGFVLQVLGEADASRSKSIVLDNGALVARAEVKKGLSVARNVTIYPDGRTEEGLPTDVRDIQNIKKRLEQAIEIDYQPFDAP